MAIELLEWALLFVITAFSGLLGLFVAYKVEKPRIKRWLEGQRLAIGNHIARMFAETVENIDVGEIVGQLGGGEGGAEGLDALTGLVGGKGGGIMEILASLAKMGGKGNQGGGSSGW